MKKYLSLSLLAMTSVVNVRAMDLENFPSLAAAQAPLSRKDARKAKTPKLSDVPTPISMLESFAVARHVQETTQQATQASIALEAATTQQQASIDQLDKDVRELASLELSKRTKLAEDEAKLRTAQASALQRRQSLDRHRAQLKNLQEAYEAQQQVIDNKQVAYDGLAEHVAQTTHTVQELKASFDRTSQSLASLKERRAALGGRPSLFGYLASYLGY